MIKRILILCAVFVTVWSSGAKLIPYFVDEKEIESEIQLIDKGDRKKKQEAYLNSLLETSNPFDDWENNKTCVEWVNRTYDSLTLDERIAQCFMLAAYTQGRDENMNYVLRMVREKKCGGVIFFKGNPTAQAAWTNRFNDVAKIPLFVAIDGEWGLAMRLDSTIQFPHQLTLGAIRDNEIIRKMGAEIGAECKRIGINMNFAPVIDVNNNARNPVINDRSFGEDKMNVAVKGLEYMDGMQSQNIVACAKHFPGHGDTDMDSHLTLPTINKSLEQLDSLELYPFRILFGAGVGSVMTAHLRMPQLDTTPNLPSSLSPIITTQLLQTALGYKGLIVTDALNMKGASKYYAAGVVDSMAFAAGNDILEFSENAEAGQAKIKRALVDSMIPMEELERKVKKILAYKYLLGLNKKPKINLANLTNDLNNSSAKVLQQELYNKAMTIAAAEPNMLPLSRYFSHIATVAIDNKGFSNFQTHIEQFLETDKYFFEEENTTSFSQKVNEIAQHDLVIISLNGMSRFASRNYGISDATVRFIDSLQTRTTVILTIFGSPYSLKYFENTKNILVAYEDNDASQLAAANALLGGITCTGTLPVTASDRFREGMGVISDTVIRLQIATPEEAGLKTEDLREMDEIVMNGLIARAFPGCQIALVKDNKLIWNKVSGNMTYENQKVKTTDLYDWASISKIAATTLSVMKLYDEKKLDLNKTVGDYLQLDDSATIKPLKIADVLTHQAGLKPFIEFSRNTIDSNFNTYYRTDAEPGFSTPVAECLFIRNDYKDTMWRKMYTSPIKPEQGYVYSDIDFYILQKIVEKISGQNIDDYVAQNFYQPMGLMRTLYKPYEQFDVSRIAPTEDDKIFRVQQVRGYVHDPGAAMYGGVAGHAGLFGNAVDLTQIAQLLLNKGSYNGKQYFSEETVTLFTEQYSDKSRRGLGFDKPEPNGSKQSPCYAKVPLSTFGHTGFTGTCVWSDPTNRLTFVFLSNRVYPNADNSKLLRMNVRSELQRVIYNALGK